MTREEAKLILQGSHFREEDLTDPLVKAAMEYTRTDPELTEWWETERAFDAVISSKLNQVQAPAALRAAILRRQSPADPVRSVRFPSRRILLVLAASIALIAAVSVFWLGPWHPANQDPLALLQRDLALLLKEFPRLDLQTQDWPEIRQWLSKRSSESAVDIPETLQKYPGIGCRELEWKKQRVLLVCFAANGEIVHLLVVPSSLAPTPGTVVSPRLARVRSWTSASWSRGATSYIVLTKGNESFLNGILSPNQRQG